jgi:hypothetical protein
MLRPGDMLGEYRIEALLGRGGMATVYRAYQASLARMVAIKVLPDFLAEEEGFRERFQQEAIAIARLRHPAILVVFDYGEQDGMPFLVTEYLEHGTLADRLGAPFLLTETLRLLTPIAAALDFAHERGVVHRDVKPANILIAADGSPVLADFGLAKLLDSQKRLTQTGMLMGTPHYMAPELLGGVIGPSVDRYALAVIAYEMLTGVVPFDAPTPEALLMAHAREPVPSPGTRNPSLAPAVEAALLRGLEKSPDARYPSATAFVTALREAGQAAVTGTGSGAMQEAAASPTGKQAEPKTTIKLPVVGRGGPGSRSIAAGGNQQALGGPPHSARSVRGRAWQARLVAGMAILAAALSAATAFELESMHHSISIAPGAWSAAGSLDAPVAFAQAAPLPNGNVLVAGGYGPNSDDKLADEYDAAHGIWITLPAMPVARWQFTATALKDGRILVASGVTETSFTATAALFDPGSRAWHVTGSLHVARQGHAAVRLQNGMVLVVGGEDEHYTPLRSAELYNPATGRWSLTGFTATAHYDMSAVLLPNGRVLLAGGGTSDCEIYYPETGQWRSAASMHYSRRAHTLTLLANGTVLAAGGTDDSNVGDQASAEIYDPASNTWTMTGSMHVPRSLHTATLLADGTVLVAGGEDGKQLLASAERFDPRTGRWTLVAPMHTPRSEHVAAALAGGKALIAGGIGVGTNYLGSAEIYGTS